MSRTKPILINEEYMEARSFARFIPGDTVYTTAAQLFDSNFDTSTKEGRAIEEFFKREIANVPFRPVRTIYSGTAPTPTRDYSTQNLEAINKKFMQVYRPHLSAGLINALPSDSYYHSQDETSLVSRFMLNEFFAQDEFEIYHDFLNEKWDEYYDLAISSKINEYAHTLDVYKHRSTESAFVIRPLATKKAQMALESLSKDKLLSFVKTSPSERVYSGNIETYFSNQLKSFRGEAVRQTSPRSALNQIQRAFAATIVEHNIHDNVNLYAVFENLQDILKNVDSKIARNILNYGVSEITPNDLFAIGAFLEKNASKFTLGEMFFIIYSLGSHKIFARSGKTAEIAKLYGDFIAKPNAVDIFKMIGKLAQAYDKQLPTATQWRKAFDAGDLDFIMEPEITVVLIAASDVIGSITREALERRKLFGTSL